ncbi:uncharacterized protein [Palaemon carinicauda]|uniref:uncharacterized protein n=1 Tax=Palaemon carinicauda TaxID=392227 RepID=UPI0035B6A0E4
MDKFLRPSLIDVDPESADAEDKCIMWHDNFEAFCAAINPDFNPDKLTPPPHAHVSCKLFKIIKSATTYAAAISLLKARFVKQKTVKQAPALEMAQLHSAAYASETNTTVAALIDDQAKPETNPNSFLIEMSDSPNPSECAATVNGQRCFFCGGSLHPRAHCPAKKASCSNSQELEKSQKPSHSTPASMIGAAVAAASPALRSVYRTVLPIELNRGEALDGLVDTGAFKSFIDAKVAKAMNSVTRSSTCSITMGNAKKTMKLNKCCNYNLTLSGRVYPEFCLHLMDDCVAPVVMGYNFLQLHRQVNVDFGGMLPLLELNIQSPCALIAA